MPKKMTLSEKIFAITQRCSAIKRNGVGHSNNPERPLYAYVEIVDVLAMVNPLLKKYKLILTGNVAKEPMTHVGKTWATTEVLVDWTLTDLEAQPDGLKVGEVHRVFRIPGAGVDDQGKGIYKALTGSRKYACVFIFNLQFGDEPEEVQRAATSESPTPA
jgi:hypothetical protein